MPPTASSPAAPRPKPEKFDPTFLAPSDGKDYAADLELAARTRAFCGNDELKLPVPGLKKLERVATRGGIVLPTPEDPEHRKVPVDTTHLNFDTERLPHVWVEQDPALGTVLRRHIVSNFGVFQSADIFYVSGEWDESVPPPDPMDRPLVKPNARHSAIQLRGAN